MKMSANEKRLMDREALHSVIRQWNANRLDLFELSPPDDVSFVTNTNAKKCFSYFFYFK